MFAQDETFARMDVEEGVYTFSSNKKLSPTANGITVEILGKPKNTEAVLKEKFTNAKGKSGKNMKGVIGYEATTLTAISPDVLDYYYRVEEGSSKKDETSKITFFASKGELNFIDSNRYPDEMEGAKRMLKGLGKEVHIYELGLAIVAQEKVIDLEEKKQKKLEKELDSLERTKEETIKKIEQNKVDQVEQKQEIMDQESILETLKVRLETVKGN